MAGFRFHCPLQVCYSDLDAQGHMNHARYFSFMEEARFRYILAVGLWNDKRDFNAVGQIVAEATCTYRRPAMLGEVVDVAVRVARVGRKSMELQYCLTVAGEEIAAGRTIQVAYDYAAHASIPVPDAWRERIQAYEGEQGG